MTAFFIKLQMHIQVMYPFADTENFPAIYCIQGDKINHTTNCQHQAANV